MQGISEQNTNPTMQTDKLLRGDPSLRTPKRGAFLRSLTAALLAISLGSAVAGTATYDFTADPTTGGVLIIGGNEVNTQPWQGTGGNPGGFLALTYPIGNLYSAMVFPDID